MDDNWQSYINFMMETDSLTDSEKEKVQTGIKLLRKTFDDAWLSEVVMTGHPLLYRMSNTINWSQYWLADLGNRIESLRNIHKFSELELRLKDPDQYGGAISELDSIYKLFKGGFEIKLSPRIGNGNKKADVKATLVNDETFFEVSTLMPSAKQNASWQTFRLLSHPYQFNRDVNTFFQIHKILSKPRINEFCTKIEKAIEEVKVTKGYCYIGEPNVLDYLIFSKDIPIDEARKIAENNNMKSECSGPPAPVDDVRRLEAKIWDKVEQLPKEKPSVLVLYANLLDFGDNYEIFYDDIVFEMEESIYDQDNITLGIIISNTSDLERKEYTIEKPNYFFIQKYIHKEIGEGTLIIKNRYSKFQINNKIFNAFTKL